MPFAVQPFTLESDTQGDPESAPGPPSGLIQALHSQLKPFLNTAQCGGERPSIAEPRLKRPSGQCSLKPIVCSCSALRSTRVVGLDRCHCEMPL